MQTLDVGETAITTTTWWDRDGAPFEPSTIDVTITRPDGTTILYTKADGTGTESVHGSGIDDVWTFTTVVGIAGIWTVQVVGTVAGDQVEKPSTIFFVGGAALAPSPCEPWASWDRVAGLCPKDDLSSLDVATREHLLDVATGILWSLDGRRYPGICVATRRICRSCVRCVTVSCCCSPRGAIDLGGRWPVWGVLDVIIDGETLSPASYGLRDRRWLDRLDGVSWPSCGSLADPDAFSTTIAYGRRPPIELADATAVFAGEMAKSCLGLKCEIPQRVTSITREGVSYTILDSQKFLDGGRVGIYRVDLALAAAKAGRNVPPGMSAPLRHQRSSST